MKKLSICFYLVAVCCLFGFAEGFDSVDFDYKGFSGGFMEVQEEIAGGSGEFGFKILNEKDKLIVFRNSFYLKGFGANIKAAGAGSFGGFVFGDRLQFGGRYDCNGFIVRAYGFGGAGVGLLGGEGITFFSNPYLAEIGFGGGFEFQFNPAMAFVLEFGGTNFLGIAGNLPEDFSFSSPMLKIGYRSLF